MLFSAVAVAAALGAQLANAASADDWRNRTIYQIITDRFAPPSETAPARTSPLAAECDPAAQTWCGGTWLSIIDKLDYIQSMGFDAIWISPTSRNIDFQTPYNFAYHGYWVNDVTQINPRFGSEDDLKQLSDEVHKRGMYLMVDIVINGIPALSNTTQDDPKKLQDDGSLWTESDYFHQPFCHIDWSNDTSVKYCSLGDDKLPLIDVNTEHPHVISTLQSWISEFVAKFGVDGLRIDAAKHVPGEFWQGFCGAAGVFCIGEVFDDRIDYCADFQTKKWMDSILGYPFYNGLYKAFGVAPKGNMSELTDRIIDTLTNFPNAAVLGNFLENHDTPRFRNVTADPQLAYNAMVMQFLFDGIPVLYYGQEQDMALGNADPYNRAALWPLGYNNGTTVQRVQRLINIRQSLLKADDIQFNGSSYSQSHSTILANTTYDVAIRKGPLVLSVTNRGSPEEAASFGIDSTGFAPRAAVVDLLTCTEHATGSGGSLSVSYAQPGYGGMPYVFVHVDDAKKMGFCTDQELGYDKPTSKVGSKSDAPPTVTAPSLLAGCLFTVATALGAAFFL